MVYITNRYFNKYKHLHQRKYMYICSCMYIYICVCVRVKFDTKTKVVIFDIYSDTKTIAQGNRLGLALKM